MGMERKWVMTWMEDYGDDDEDVCVRTIVLTFSTVI